MALATRCPQCGTAFRLVADQLRLHDGLVRCGACSAIFDGRQNQFEVDPTALPGPADTPVAAATAPPMTPTLVDAPPPTPISPPIPERLPEAELPAPTAAASLPETLVEPVDPALLGPVTRLVVPQAPREPEPPTPALDTPTPPVSTRAAVAPPAPPAPPAPISAAPKPPSLSTESGLRELGGRGVGVRELAPRAAGPREPVMREPGTRESGNREPGNREPGMREPSIREPIRDAGPVEPALPNLDFPAIGIDAANAHGPGAREPSLHEPLPLAPSGDANLLHAPQSFGAREAPDATAESRREPRFLAPELPATPTTSRAADPRDPSASRVRASVIDDGMPTPRLRSRADGTIPDLRARLRADAEAEAAETQQVPELRRESADPTAPMQAEAPRELPAEPIYAWDPSTEDTEVLPPVEVDTPPPRLLAEPEEPEAPRRAWPWVLGILVAALALGAQGVWVLRDEIATNLPITRPLLTAVCAPFGCTVGYPRHPELLSIESSALEPWQSDPTAADAGAPGRLALRVVLRNRHTLPQPWPSIELTLTDLSDAAVVRRVLAPSDYLPADTVSKPMPPRSERSLRVPVDPPPEAVSGYRLSVFFP